jgi:hypothetical protein
MRRVASASAKSIKRSIERWEAGGRPDQRYWLLLAHAYATTSDGEADLGPGSDFEQLMHAFELIGVDLAAFGAALAAEHALLGSMGVQQPAQRSFHRWLRVPA